MMATQPTNPFPPFEISRALVLPSVSHGFFGRKGGVSSGFYESLNTSVSSGDEAALVRENRARAAAAFGLPEARLSVLRQTHSAICHIIDTPYPQDVISPEGDAMVTNQTSLGLGVVTADCAPVLFAANGVVGAAHAGWGGALGGVLEATLEGMEKLGAARSEVKAAIGPCIGQASYEVSAGFEQPFLMEDAFAERFFKSAAKPEKLVFDLAGYCAYRLARAGVGTVDIIGLDTCAREDAYFSHRRATQRGEPTRGLQLSLISLNHKS